MSVHSSKLHTTVKLTPMGKEYTFFQIDGKSAQASMCVKSSKMTKVVDCVLSIDTLDQQYLLLKVMLQPPRLKDCMKNIGID